MYKDCLDGQSLYISPTGSDTTGDGTSSNPWYSPHRAIEWLSTRSIFRDRICTISCAAGEYNFSSTISLNLENGQNVELVGAGMTAIQDISNDQNTLTVTGHDLESRTADNIINMALIRSRFFTIFNFSNATTNQDAIVCTRPFSSIRNIAIIANNERMFEGIIVTNNASLRVTNLAICNFSSHGVRIIAGSICNLTNFISVNNHTGIISHRGGSGTMHNINVVSSRTKGIIVLSGGNVEFSGFLSVAGNVLSGVEVNQGGSLVTSNAKIFLNGGDGVACMYDGYILIPHSQINRNGGCGVNAVGGTVLCYLSTLADNGFSGIKANLAGWIGADLCIFNNNNVKNSTGHAEILTSHTAYIYALGSTFSGIGNTPRISAGGSSYITIGNNLFGITYSPAYGLVGNGNAMIFSN